MFLWRSHSVEIESFPTNVYCEGTDKHTNTHTHSHTRPSRVWLLGCEHGLVMTHKKGLRCVVRTMKFITGSRQRRASVSRLRNRIGCNSLAPASRTSQAQSKRSAERASPFRCDARLSHLVCAFTHHHHHHPPTGRARARPVCRDAHDRTHTQLCIRSIIEAGPSLWGHTHQATTRVHFFMMIHII